MPRYGDDQNDVSALTFFSSQRSDDDSGLGALRAQSSAGSADDDGLGALRAQSAVESHDTTTDVDALRSVTGGGHDAQDAQLDEAGEYLAKVTNLPGTVAVTALPDGSILQIDLRPQVANMAESALADEILAIADLARQKGLAKQQAFIADALQAVELDDDTQELVAASLDLPTPQQAEAAQAEMFAARYAAGAD